MSNITYTSQPDLLIWYVRESGMPQSIDGVAIGSDGIQRGLYSGETLEEISRRYANPVITDYEAFQAVHDSAWTSDPAPITKDRFNEMLDVLPPLGYINDRSTESFKMIERESGNITGIYARLGESYWSFNGRDDMPHSEIIRRCAAIRAKSNEEAWSPA